MLRRLAVAFSSYPSYTLNDIVPASAINLFGRNEETRHHRCGERASLKTSLLQPLVLIGVGH